jgi:hypothetical protein
MLLTISHVLAFLLGVGIVIGWIAAWQLTIWLMFHNDPKQRTESWLFFLFFFWWFGLFGVICFAIIAGLDEWANKLIKRILPKSIN